MSCRICTCLDRNSGKQSESGPALVGNRSFFKVCAFPPQVWQSIERAWKTRSGSSLVSQLAETKKAAQNGPLTTTSTTATFLGGRKFFPRPVNENVNRCSHGLFAEDASVCFVCVLWKGNNKTPLYDADYVLKLHGSVFRHYNRAPDGSAPSFFCYTDDAALLQHDRSPPAQSSSSTIRVPKTLTVLPLDTNRTGWWFKASLLSQKELKDFGKVVFLDLDQVIVGNLHTQTVSV